MVLSAGIRRVFGLFDLVFDVTFQFSLEAGFSVLELDVVYNPGRMFFKR